MPCKLCLEERIPYYVGVPIALVALLSAALGGPAWLTRGALALAAIVFLIGAGLGTYHAGAEWTWWPGPGDCGATSTGATDTGGLLDSLKNIRVVSCTEASWRFPPANWGLSFAGWNAVISAVLAAGCCAGAPSAAPQRLAPAYGSSSVSQ